MKVKILTVLLAVLTLLSCTITLAACNSGSGETGSNEENLQPTQGLEYKDFGDSTIAVSGIGSATNQTRIVIPSEYNGKPVSTILNAAFMNCKYITSVIIPDSVVNISMWAFIDCTSLTVITIPDKAIHIGIDAFKNTAYYNNKNNWENDVLYIGNHLIEAKSTIANDYVIKQGTISIANNAFESCASLTSITIPNSVTSIDSYAFEDCTSLTNITIPNSVTFIGNYAFKNCTSLVNITIPNSVTFIGSDAFSSCTSLTNINFNGTKEEWKAIKKYDSWNENTGEYVVHCTDGDLSKQES